MAYNTPPTKNTGDTFTAGEFNTYIRDNFAAGVPDIFQAAGDLAVGSGPDSAARLPAGAEGQLLKVVGGAVGWDCILTARQGGSATSWATGGTTNYTPSQAKVFLGTANVTLSSGSGSVTITFPSSFSGLPVPIIYVNVTASGYVAVTSLGLSSMSLSVNAGTISGTFQVFWIAIGPS